MISVAGDDNKLREGPALQCLIPFFVRQSEGYIASPHQLGPRTNEFWQICGFGLHITPSKVGLTMGSGNELSLSDQSVQ